ncbi:MAG: type II toxin-antitoxin system VapC family toxin [Coxiellaceae bacterium]|nr:MAG: type II toxin-antitoxin system VapC family toxin [Coxiellaceae bacterium]
MTILRVLLNQNATTACNLNLKLRILRCNGYILEASIKAQLGKLDVDMNGLINAITESGYLELPLTVKHAAVIYDLPNFHRDPFDRMLIAQAIREPLKLLTADAQLQEYSNLVHLV